MNLTANNLFLLCLAALVLGAAAVLIDRVNFPQKPFRPKRIQPPTTGTTKDRTGAHILEEADEGSSQL